jgi:two-component system cell cycle response regulator DivK
MSVTNRVLIVEDHPLNLKLFRDILTAKGYQTLEDRVGSEAVKLAERHQPTFIILDVLLPYSSGIEIARTLKSKIATKNIPIIAVTALAITETHQKMLQAGCCVCLVKPFSLDQFLKAIDDAIKSKTVNRVDINDSGQTHPLATYQRPLQEAV